MMMALEGPFLAAVIARLADPTFNLAAHGVAYAFAILVESPVIMLMSASTALVDGRRSYLQLRNFAAGLNVLATALLLLVLLPPVFDAIMNGLLALPADVASLINGALWLLLPWPAAIGYRRFLHGVLLRSGRTRLVAYGTGLRLAAMAVTAVALAAGGIPGAWVGAAALSAGVLTEAVATRIMAAGAIRELLSAEEVFTTDPQPGAVSDPAGADAESAKSFGPAEAVPGTSGIRGYAAITRFYYPLALTSFISLSVQPLLTFFMGRGAAPLESLGLSYQELTIALVGRRAEHAREIARFGAGLAIVASIGLALVAFTPLATFWFEVVSGLPVDLAGIALTPARLLVPLPALAVALSFQRAILVQTRETPAITAATALEIVVIAILFPLLGGPLRFIGVTAAVAAFLGGRLAGVLFLAPRTFRTLRDAGG